MAKPSCRHRRTNKLRYLDSCVLTALPTRIYKNTTGMINLKKGHKRHEHRNTLYRTVFDMYYFVKVSLQYFYQDIKDRSA